MSIDYPRFATDPLELLSSQHQSGIDLLGARSTLIFYLNSNRSAEFIQSFNRVNGQINFWRGGVLNNLKSLPSLPKRLENRFSSNQSPYIDPRYSDPNDALGRLFSALKADLDILAEVIDYAATAKANKADAQSLAQSVVPNYYRDIKQLVFCNKIIDAGKGKDFAMLCDSMFYNGKPKKQPQSLGDLLEKWQEPDYRNTKRVHNAVNNFNKLVAQLTTIDDLFFVKNKQVHFNVRYI
ncbi:MAG TPA: hypothetical protein VGF75_00720 [Candidatus Saccharimonadales bacterium]